MLLPNIEDVILKKSYVESSAYSIAQNNMTAFKLSHYRSNNKDDALYAAIINNDKCSFYFSNPHLFRANEIAFSSNNNIINSPHLCWHFSSFENL